MKQLPRTQKGPYRVTPVGEAKPPSIVYAIRILDLVTLNPHFERDFWSPVCQKETSCKPVLIYLSSYWKSVNWRNTILFVFLDLEIECYPASKHKFHHMTLSVNLKLSNPWNKHTAQPSTGSLPYQRIGHQLQWKTGNQKSISESTPTSSLHSTPLHEYAPPRCASSLWKDHTRDLTGL